MSCLVFRDTGHIIYIPSCSEAVAALRVPRRGLRLVLMTLLATEEARVQPITGALLRLTGAAAMRTVALEARTETILLAALGTRLTGGRRTSSSENL